MNRRKPLDAGRESVSRESFTATAAFHENQLTRTGRLRTSSMPRAIILDDETLVVWKEKVPENEVWQPPGFPGAFWATTADAARARRDRVSCIVIIGGGGGEKSATGCCLLIL